MPGLSWQPWHDGVVGELIRRNAAIVLHGAGSSAVAARRLLPPALFPAADATYVTDPDSRPRRMHKALDDWYRCDRTPNLRFVVGISLGAHTVGAWLAHNPEKADAAILIMPAWTGPPDAAASVTASAAALLHKNGVEDELRRIQQATHPDRTWIIEALLTTWSSQPKGRLVAAMERAARVSAPSLVDLSSISVPTLVLGLRDDPLHPIATARAWANVIPSARCVELADHEIAESGNFATSRVARAWETLLGELASGLR